MCSTKLNRKGTWQVPRKKEVKEIYCEHKICTFSASLNDSGDDVRAIRKILCQKRLQVRVRVGREKFTCDFVWARLFSLLLSRIYSLNSRSWIIPHDSAQQKC